MEFKEVILTEEDIKKYGSEEDVDILKKSKVFTDFEEFKQYIGHKYSSPVVDYYTDEETHDIILVLDNGLKIRTIGKVGLPKGESEYHVYRQKKRRLEKEIENVENSKKIIKEDINDVFVVEVDDFYGFNKFEINYWEKSDIPGPSNLGIDEYEEEEEERFHVIETITVKYNIYPDYESWGINGFIFHPLEVILNYKDGDYYKLDGLEKMDYRAEFRNREESLDYLPSMYPKKIIFRNDKRLDFYF